jgi:hypothetical protein
MPALMKSGAPFLSGPPFVAGVAPETLARFEHRMRHRELAPRAVIVRKGSSDGSASVVLKSTTCGIIAQSDFDQPLAAIPCGCSPKASRAWRK